MASIYYQNFGAILAVLVSPQRAPLALDGDATDVKVIDDTAVGTGGVARSVAGYFEPVSCIVTSGASPVVHPYLAIAHRRGAYDEATEAIIIGVAQFHIGEMMGGGIARSIGNLVASV